MVKENILIMNQKVTTDALSGITYSPWVLPRSLYISYEEVLEEGKVVITASKYGSNVFIVYRDFFVSCYGNCVEDIPSEKAAQQLATELIFEVTGNRCNFSSALSTMKVPMLFQDVNEAHDFIELFTDLGLQVRTDRLAYISLATFRKEYAL